MMIYINLFNHLNEIGGFKGGNKTTFSKFAVVINHNRHQKKYLIQAISPIETNIINKVW